jgi:Tol biopolymer transport system component
MIAGVAACGTTAEETEVLVGKPPTNDRGQLNFDDEKMAEEKEAAEKKPEKVEAPPPPPAVKDPLSFDGETALPKFVQLTQSGRTKAVAVSDKRFVFQATRDGASCDALFTMNRDGSAIARVSSGEGLATDGHFVPGGAELVFASTHLSMKTCPAKLDAKEFGPDVWPVHNEFEIFKSKLDGSGAVPLTKSKGYDAEATVSPKGDRIVFTSARSGDLEIYSMNLQGKDVKRLTKSAGYDGGASFGPKGEKIVFHGNHATGKEGAEGQKLLKKGLVKGEGTEIYVMDSAGKGVKQLTHFGATSFAPAWHPDGKRIVFMSNMHDPDKKNFDLYLINVDATGKRRLTFNPTFDGFPTFDESGKKLVFVSGRNSKGSADTNLFVADWKD